MCLTSGVVSGSARTVRKKTGALRPAACLAWVALLACIAVTGCNRGPAGLVEVSGKLTLDNGPWPKQGQISFSPVKAAAGHPILVGMARVNADGSFSIQTPSSPGLVPGEYNAAVLCWLEAPDDNRAGKSAVAERYQHPQTSGLNVTVPEGSAPIRLNWDIKSK
jgi:hypothetical protein